MTSVVTAGLLSEVGTILKIKPDSTIFSDRLISNFTNSVGATLVQTAINGGNLEDNLEAALLAGLAGSLQGELAQNIKPLEDVNYIIHKIAHAAAGCIAGAVQKSCEAGAIGAGVGEVLASYLNDGTKVLTEQEKNSVIDKSKLLAGVIAAYTGYDVNVAANSADIAVKNNNMEVVYQAELDSLWESSNGDKNLYYEGVQKIAERDALALEILSIPFGGGAITYRGFLKIIESLVAKGSVHVTKEGLSAAARKLSSHSQRVGGTFSQPRGNIAEQNAFAEKVLRDILNDPNTRIKTLSRGGVEYRKPNGQGVRYNADGSFSGFVDPTRK